MRHAYLPQFVSAVQSPGRANLVGHVRDATAHVHISESTAFVTVALAVGAVMFVVATVLRSRPQTDDRQLGIRACTGLQIGGLATVFATLAWLVADGVGPSAWDPAVLSWFVDHRTAWLTGPAVAITDTGGPAGTVLAAVVIGGWLSWRARSPLPALVLIGTVGAAALASTVMKSVVGRPRPPVISQVLLETDNSFPSGHATGATALLVTAAVLAGHELAPARRRALLIGAIAVSAVVALTRLYLGEHWLTDVVGGMVLGGLAALIGTALYLAWVQRAGGRVDAVVASGTSAHG